MSEDRPVAPSPARLRRAWLAGFRPRSPWLLTAAVVAAFGLFFRGWRPSLDRVIEPTAAALRHGAPQVDVLATWVHPALVLFSTLVAGILAVVVGVGLATGSLGPVSKAQAQQLRPVAVRRSLAVVALVAIVLAGVLAASLVAVLAAGARAPDASLAGLVELYRAWVVRLCSTAAVGLGVAGLVDRWLESRRRNASLHQTVQEVQHDLRERGGGGR